jgi:hypothetical protein
VREHLSLELGERGDARAELAQLLASKRQVDGILAIGERGPSPLCLLSA